MTQKALVTGASGLLGRQVLNAFKKDVNWEAVGQGFTRAAPPDIVKADLTNPSEIESLLDEVKPQVVVHCAANRFPDQCDAHPDLARKVNVEATKALAKATLQRSILLIYISTDYVFPGRPGEAPYETSSQTEPPNIYGQTKLDGEIAVIETTQGSGKGVVLRVPVLYGSADTNSESAVNVLIDAVWKAQDADAKVKMDDWGQRYPTNTEDVGRVCHDIAVKYLGEQERAASFPTILQFSSEDKVTKYEMCERFAEILGLPLSGMERIKQGGTPGNGVQRPFDTHLSTKALKELGIPVDTQDFVSWWRRELRAYRH
ncbi:dTDP-4-dehydrorhamnose reductase [Coccidioides immitis RS]|uniref:dTDP-4-dehydrorhamnose reductase n=4 Tax=Coccidioides immitis TaxID=5501 RepID=A0A0E1RWR3_COCIM|nr:dTDP-4-dehydrorhamnose reductase [Coccidioides immitis RS]KMP03558.1 methionine adenosyltransferase 2 subunit beta [Coccidioides immitis RMSCC 2394]KMU73146.1 methionine adenosyltransferase 2 subunit beta [Coccidioides immitis RMSCC 3703]KMU83050.1 methionine adenosyltransferase 2 subunit beta [Coccidioides immitis H538.4]TPX23834.1 hypothetical protein DIZ76_013177 [Coccidioides immitis]EAS30963.2 dTDP-4-dehydrorhamnose reductase [Coccidioides immitis RS]